MFEIPVWFPYLIEAAKVCPPQNVIFYIDFILGCAIQIIESPAFVFSSPILIYLVLFLELIRLLLYYLDMEAIYNNPGQKKIRNNLVVRK
jgi:hypothetical protein